MARATALAISDTQVQAGQPTSWPSTSGTTNRPIAAASTSSPRTSSREQARLSERIEVLTRNRDAVADYLDTVISVRSTHEAAS
jgi:hypothetical protein